MEIKELLVSAGCLRAEEIKPATTDSNIKHLLAPPGGVAAMDATIYAPKSSPKDELYHLYPAASLLAYFNPNLSYTFWISNHISFMASLSVVFIYFHPPLDPWKIMMHDV
ncbi:hypothetical protein POM88_053897 [Heracleum sosnowskyi]|uniref:Uncharacterized protein n=1 Tax=Heracleum sosnowskyi TaxID=360622 RepID=A0AAD8GN68_9APIA|nr:hypothetical protein POM88_053897 [Heracleum sosnowskyi]